MRLPCKFFSKEELTKNPRTIIETYFIQKNTVKFINLVDECSAISEGMFYYLIELEQTSLFPYFSHEIKKNPAQPLPQTKIEDRRPWCKQKVNVSKKENWTAFRL